MKYRRALAILIIILPCLLSFSVNKGFCDSFGTAFLISPQGHLVTNFHVIDSAEKIMVSLKGKQYIAKLISQDKANDLAIIQIAGKFKYLNYKDSSKLPLGSEVYAIGFPNPDLQGVSPKVSNGIISSLAGLSDDPRHFQISCSIQPGNSGGPIIDKLGNYYGIVTSTLSPFFMANYRGSLPQNVNYAIKNFYLQPLAPWITSQSESCFSTIEEITQCVGLVHTSSYKYDMPQSQGNVIIANSRFVRDNRGIILDRKTNLKWYEGPDYPMSWYQADNWIKASGKHWRFPTVEELQEIYDKSSNRKGDPCDMGTGILGPPIALRLDPAFRTQKAYSVWSTEFDDDSANMFGFSTGMELVQNKSAALEMYRVFAVSK